MEQDSASDRIPGPDFICVGMPKAGTGWLYDQLKVHPDFWMPPIKELSYFKRRSLPRGLKEPLEKLRDTGKMPERALEKRLKRRLDQRDVQFLERFTAVAEDRTIEEYLRLFEAKGELRSGDISPLYSSMKGSKIGRLACGLPRTKVVALLRDPVERAWSHWRMAVEKNRYDAESVQDVARFRRFFSDSTVLDRSRPTVVVKRWRKQFSDRFRYYFLDDIATDPDATRAAIIAFIGADADKPTTSLPSENRKASPRVARSPEIQAEMRKLFTQERADCARILGGPALAWAEAPY